MNQIEYNDEEKIQRIFRDLPTYFDNKKDMNMKENIVPFNV